MNTVERIISICKERGIPISKLERSCDFANGYIRRLTKGTMPNDRLARVADYLGVTVEYLTTGENSNGYYYDKETAELAQQIYQNPELHMLFNATKDATPGELKMFYDMVMVMKQRENEGN